MDLTQFTEEEVARRWLFLRAAEWKNWPSFVSQPIVPILFIFCPWYYIFGGVLFLDILWAGLRYRYVNVSAAASAVSFVEYLKWPAGIGSAIYLFTHHSYLAGVLAILWPLGLSGLITVPGQTGRIEMLIAHKIGALAETRSQLEE